MIFDVREIGRYELGSDFLQSGLRMGITKASLSLAGMIPVFREPVQSIHRGVMSSFIQCLNNIQGTPSGPHEVELGSFYIARLISFLDINMLFSEKELLYIIPLSCLLIGEGSIVL